MENKPAAPPSYEYNAVPQEMGTTVITIQPSATSWPSANGVRQPMYPYREWSSTLCSCFDDITSCALTFLFGTFYECYLFHNYDECFLTPVCVPGSHIHLRLKHRQRHGINGTIYNDCCTGVFCGPCVICQVKRDMDYVRKAGFEL